MRRSPTFGHGHFTHKKTHAKSPWRKMFDPIFFIITTIIAAGFVAAIIRTNQIDIASILSPQVGIVAPEFRATNTPHDDICTDVFVNLSAIKNIKGFSEHGKMGSDCVSRQMSNGVELSD